MTLSISMSWRSVASCTSGEFNPSHDRILRFMRQFLFLFHIFQEHWPVVEIHDGSCSGKTNTEMAYRLSFPRSGFYLLNNYANNRQHGLVMVIASFPVTVIDFITLTTPGRMARSASFNRDGLCRVRMQITKTNNKNCWLLWGWKLICIFIKYYHEPALTTRFAFCFSAPAWKDLSPAKPHCINTA